MMADRADQVVIVADSSKLGQRAFARICVPERIDVLDTDSEVSEIAVALFAERGIRVITARGGLVSGRFRGEPLTRC